MGGFRTFFVWLILTVSLKSPAGVVEACAVSFRRAYFSEKVCADGQCHNNAYRLLERFTKNPEFKADEAKILFFLPNVQLPSGNYTPDFPIPKTARGYDPWDREGWNYHAVVYYRGKVYDLDFKEQPTVVSTKDFFNEMFPLVDGRRDVKVYDIPGNVYLEKHPRPGAADDKAGERPSHIPWIRGNRYYGGTVRTLDEFLTLYGDGVK